MSPVLVTQSGDPLLTEDNLQLETSEAVDVVVVTPTSEHGRIFSSLDDVSSRFIEAVSGIHRVASFFEVLDGSDIVGNIEIVDGNATFDGQSSLDIEVVVNDIDIIPTDPRSLLAPYGNEIKAWAGVRFDDADELVPMGIYRIESANVSDTGDNLSVSVTGQDRSIRVTEDTFEADQTWAAGTSAIGLIRSLIARDYPDADVTTYFNATDFPLPLIQANGGDDPWAFAQGIAAAIGCDLFWNDDGIPVLRPTPVSSGDPQWMFSENEILTSISKEWNREGIANKVIVQGDSGSLDAPIIGEAVDSNPNSPTYYDGKFGKVQFFYSTQFVSTQTQANDAASGILNTKIGFDQAINFGSIIDPRVRPLDIIEVKRDRIGVDELHVLDAVSIPFIGDGTMNGDTRKVQVFS